jgi:hypothetical protein
MPLLRERRSRHRRELPSDHLRQHRRNRPLPRGRQLLPQPIRTDRREFQAPRSNQRDTGRGGTVSRADMTHFLVLESGVPGTTAPA